MTQNFILATLSIFIVAINSVNSQLSTDPLQPHNEPSYRQKPSLIRARRMYALCPPQFVKVGNDCYFLSTKKESWLDAHFECKDKNSKLASPLKYANIKLQKYLKNRDQLNDDKWIGGMYNWQQEKWQWGYNGGDITYQAFADEVVESDLRYHCLAMDPKIDYKWSAKLCHEQHNFVCQHRMSLVEGKNRQRFYTRWNETYPNQLLNEVEVYVSTNEKTNRKSIVKSPRKNRPALNKKILETQTPKSQILDNAPDYLPYSAYSNLEQMQQRNQEDVIHPVQSSHASIPKKPPMKPRKRHSKPLRLTGEVNLGDQFNRDRKQRPKERRKHIDRRVNTIEEQTTTNAARHHHHNLPNEIQDFAEVPETTEEPSTEQQIFTTSTQSSAEKAADLETKKKLDEKAMRRERLKQKLALLSPEERQAFLLMKQQRAEAKKKGLLN